MRISDWSSDVCSSDLPVGIAAAQPLERAEVDAHLILVGRHVFRHAVLPEDGVLEVQEVARKRSRDVHPPIFLRHGRGQAEETMIARTPRDDCRRPKGIRRIVSICGSARRAHYWTSL